MAYYYGRDAKVLVGTSTSVQIKSWKITGSTKTEDVTCLGDAGEKFIPMITSWNATLEAIFDPSDTNGQLALEAAHFAKTKLQVLKFYLDGTKYYAPDTAGDTSAGAYITGFNPSQSKGGLAMVEFTLTGYGNIKLT